MTIQDEIFAAVVAGDSPAADRLVAQALAAGADPEALLQAALVPAMTEVGARFQAGEYFVSEMLVSAQAMKAGLKHLRPLLVSTAAKPIGTVVIGTVKGDLHDVGKNLVGMMLEGAGFKVIDLGVDVPPQRFVGAAAESGAGLVALSALLTTTMLNMKAVVDALKANAATQGVKVLIGGAPLSQDYADKIKADGFAPDAAAAAESARALIAPVPA
ncbi:MAG: cobalamin-dependent protein [Anaerolineales bacterium]|nr:cobalamin-dependent protein [Anaerolineales bacterium]